MKVAGCGLRFRWAQLSSKRRNLLLSLRAEFLPAPKRDFSRLMGKPFHAWYEAVRDLKEGDFLKRGIKGLSKALPSGGRWPPPPVGGRYADGHRNAWIPVRTLAGGSPLSIGKESSWQIQDCYTVGKARPVRSCRKYG